MMQVNLFTSQDSLSASSSILHHNQQIKAQCVSLDNQMEEAGDLNLTSFACKPQLSNNNQADLPKDIFNIVQGSGKVETKFRRISSAHHQKLLLQAARDFCIEKEFVDVHVKCDDGTIAAHSLILGISPFLRRLLSAERAETAVILLPDVKVSVIQALLEFLYTGSVSTLEGQFYSLIKLIYDLEINASFEAEKTNEQPTKFDITPIVKSNSDFECQSCRPRKRARIDTFDSTFNALFDASNNVQTTSKNINMTSQESVNLWAKSGGLVVNSLTASGVEVKQEPEEKPALQDDQLEQADLRTLLSKTSFNLTSTINTLSSNTVNNNQLGHFVSLNPGYQVKLELPASSVGQLLTSSSSPPPAVIPPANSNKEASPNPDDPLAAIMNQTIFGGDGNMSTMYIQVNSNGFVNGNQKGQPTPPSKPQQHPVVKDKDPAPGPVHQENIEEMPCLPDDEDHNTSYNCESCNRVMKGKVMLQAHRFQEHHENPDFEARSFPDDKYACRVCLKLFTRNSDVKAHILRVHCGDRRYPCTLCGKRFKESTHLRKHLYTHTGERPHFCSYCSKGFQTSSDLKRHKKTRVHQERVDQCNIDRNSANSETTTDKSLDTSINFTRWNEADEEELENTLNSASGSPFNNLNPVTTQPPSSPFANLNPVRSQAQTSLFTNINSVRTQPPTSQFTNINLARAQPPTSTFSTINPGRSQSPPSPFSTLNPVRSQPPTPPFPTVNNPTLSSTVNVHQRIQTTLPYTTASTQFVQLPPRVSNSTLVFSNPSTSPTHQVHFVSEPLSKPSWQSQTGMALQSIPDNQLTSVSLSNSPLADVLSSIPSQNLGVQNLSLPSTTLDLSDIKWGILEPTVTIKRSGSTESPGQEEERLTIQEDL